MGKCLKRVIRKYDPDDEEVCFPFNKGTILVFKPFGGTAKQFLNRGLLTRDEVQLTEESLTRYMRSWCSCPGGEWG